MYSKLMVFVLLAFLGLAAAGCAATSDSVEKTDKWLQSDIYDYM